MMMIILLVCSVVAFVALYRVTVKSNRVLFYDNNKKSDNLPLVAAGSNAKDRNEANIAILGAGFNVNRVEGGEVKRGEELYNSHKKMLVDGRSMREFGIKNGDLVLIDEQKKEEFLEGTNSIIVLRVPKENLGKAEFTFKKKVTKRYIEYKLRKFIDFIDCSDFKTVDDCKEWIGKNYLNVKKQWDEEDKEDRKNEIKENTENKISECIKERSKLVLSESRKRSDRWYRRRKVHYSLHPADRIIGRVEYKIPRERVYLSNKVYNNNLV